MRPSAWRPSRYSPSRPAMTPITLVPPLKSHAESVIALWSLSAGVSPTCTHFPSGNMKRIDPREMPAANSPKRRVGQHAVMPANHVPIVVVAGPPRDQALGPRVADPARHPVGPVHHGRMADLVGGGDRERVLPGRARIERLLRPDAWPRRMRAPTRCPSRTARRRPSSSTGRACSRDGRPTRTGGLVSRRIDTELVDVPPSLVAVHVNVTAPLLVSVVSVV